MSSRGKAPLILNRGTRERSTSRPARFSWSSGQGAPVPILGDGIGYRIGDFLAKSNLTFHGPDTIPTELPRPYLQSSIRSVLNINSTRVPNESRWWLLRISYSSLECNKSVKIHGRCSKYLLEFYLKAVIQIKLELPSKLTSQILQKKSV